MKAGGGLAKGDSGFEGASIVINRLWEVMEELIAGTGPHGHVVVKHSATYLHPCTEHSCIGGRLLHFMLSLCEKPFIVCAASLVSFPQCPEPPGTSSLSLRDLGLIQVIIVVKY